MWLLYIFCLSCLKNGTRPGSYICNLFMLAIKKFSCHTSLISFILEPPFPMREPHWLAGTTSLKVTGGLLVAGLLLIELIMS